jgi:hypothetical protein
LPELGPAVTAYTLPNRLSLCNATSLFRKQRQSQTLGD